MTNTEMAEMYYARIEQLRIALRALNAAGAYTLAAKVNAEIYHAGKMLARYEQTL